MSSEDQLAERLSRRLRAEVAVLEQPADLLTVLHSRQARRARARRAGLAAAPLAIMGAAAAVVVLGTGAGGVPGHPAPARSSDSVPRQGTLRTAILTAFHGAQGYVLYDSSTTTIAGQAEASGSWYWPAQPSARAARDGPVPDPGRRREATAGCELQLLGTARRRGEGDWPDHRRGVRQPNVV